MTDAMVNRSARILGELYQLSAQEMNVYLREQGFLDGLPGLYFVTDKGRPFADEQSHSRGTGTYARYNRSWDTLTWHPSITEEFDLTEERREHLRETVRAARQAKRDAASAAFDTGAIADDGEAGSDLRRNLVIAGAVVVVVGASAYGIWKAAPPHQETVGRQGRRPPRDDDAPVRRRPGPGL